MANTQKTLSLRLPMIPKDKYYEDYVAAILNTGGYYLQRSVHHYEGNIEMLELDVVATKISSDKVEKTIIEIKSGNWGIKDVFKVSGWLQYLQLKDSLGVFVFQNDVSEHEYRMMNKVAETLKIHLIPNNRKDDGSIDDNLLKDEFSIDINDIHKSVISSFRYAFNLERIFLDYLHEYERKYPEFETPKKVYNYLRELNDKSFLYQEPISRLKFLCDLSYEHRFIGAIMYNEIKGNGLKSPDERPDFGSDYFNIFFEKPDDFIHIHVAQHATLLNKLYVLETIIEYIVQNNKATEDDIISNFILQTNISALNRNIQEFIDKLKNKPNYHLYPYLWQVFLYVFGGFILENKKEEEYNLLSQITKLPKENIDDAFFVWDELFPYNKGWFQQPQKNSNIKLLKMLPAPLYGIGMNFRLHLYGTNNVDLFDNLKKQLTGVHTFDNLLNWNNSAYHILKRDINLHVSDLQIKEKYDNRLDEVKNYIENCNYYTRVESFDEVIQAKHINPKDFNKGFIAYYEDNTYDIYIIKNNNKNEKLNIYNCIKDFKLNGSLFVNGIILGTDESVGAAVNDKVWYFSYFENSSLNNIESIIIESNNVRSK